MRFEAILAAVFDLNELVEMTSIGTLMAYILVSASVVILRSKIQSCQSGSFKNA
jgi:amino acid transporter